MTLSLVDAASDAGAIGLGAAVLSVGIPLGLLKLAKQVKPTTRIAYATRFAMWPAILWSFTLGGPLAREFAGLHSRYSVDLGMAVVVWLLVSALLAPFAFGLGYMVGGSRFPTKPPLSDKSDPPTPGS